MSVVPLAEACDERVFGGKAVSLGAAVRAGLPVPPGVALSASFVRHVGESDPDARAALDALSLSARRMAVRSSAVGEDSGAASFAGQHATVLNVARAGLCEAVGAVWRSAHGESALAYRRRRGLAGEPAIGVVVQALVEPVAAGVLFTRNPVTGARERVIEAAWGLGEAVVNGLVVPDRYRLDADGAVLEMQVGHKDVKVWYDGDHGTAELPVPAEQQCAHTLDAAHLSALHDLASRCCTTYGPDLDLEWALGHDGAVYLLQARPITAMLPR